MDHPFDIKDLVARLKLKGLDVAEEMASVIAKETFAWGKESCLLSPSVYVKPLAGVLDVIEPFVDKAIDKIDGQVG